MKALVHSSDGQSKSYSDIDIVIKAGVIAISDVAGLHLYPIIGTTLHLSPENEQDDLVIRGYLEELNNQ